MLSDLHVHTHHSCDSKTTMEQYCIEAIKQDIKCICFTDHVDYNENDIGYGFYKPNVYFDEFKKVQDKYSDKITLFSGIEFSEPHVYKKELDKLSELPYDFIIGSLHFWIDNLFVSEMVKQKITLKQCFKRYWEEVYKAVSCGGFDSFGHFDFPKRYYKDSCWKEAEITDIFKELVKNNISLEINTSSLRKGLTETMPNKNLLDIYEKIGGRKITIGSDSHSINELAKGYTEAEDMLSSNMVNGYYKNRTFSAF